MKYKKYILLALVITTLTIASISFAAWTPLITAADFSPIQTDVGTAAAGVVSVLLVVIGLGFLIRTFTR